VDRHNTFVQLDAKVRHCQVYSYSIAIMIGDKDGKLLPKRVGRGSAKHRKNEGMKGKLNDATDSKVFREETGGGSMTHAKLTLCVCVCVRTCGVHVASRWRFGSRYTRCANAQSSCPCSSGTHTSASDAPLWR